MLQGSCPASVPRCIRAEGLQTRASHYHSEFERGSKSSLIALQVWGSSAVQVLRSLNPQRP